MYSWKGEIMFRDNWEEAFPEETQDKSVKMSGGIEEAIAQAERMLCAKGLPHTGMDNRAEHGHVECWVIGELLNEIERLRSKVERLSSPLHPAGMSAIDKVEFFHEQIVKIVKGYND